jgi:hypothetical protein
MRPALKWDGVRVSFLPVRATALLAGAHEIEVYYTQISRHLMLEYFCSSVYISALSVPT